MYEGGNTRATILSAAPLTAAAHETLPAAIACYQTSTNARDIDAYMACFTLDGALAVQKQRDNQPPEAAIAVFKRMNQFKLRVQNGGLNEDVRLVRVVKPRPLFHQFRHQHRIRRYESRLFLESARDAKTAAWWTDVAPKAEFV